MRVDKHIKNIKHGIAKQSPSQVHNPWPKTPIITLDPRTPIQPLRFPLQCSRPNNKELEFPEQFKNNKVLSFPIKYVSTRVDQTKLGLFQELAKSYFGEN
jgi:hypothetical protein